MNELVSVIVPVYNVEKYLKKCVNSIINQTYKSLEIILVDDGSPDRSGALCDRLAEKDSRIRVIHKANGGVSTARNAGIEAATGEYICFVDSDDWLPENAIWDMVSLAEKEKADFVMGSAIQVGVTRALEIQLCQKESFTKPQCDKLMGYECMLRSPWAKLFSRKIVQDNHLRFAEGMAYGEDRAFVWSYLCYCNRFSITSSVVYYYSLLNLSNACSKYYPQVNEWMLSWIEPAFSMITTNLHDEDHKKKILNLIVVEQLHSVCGYYANAEKLDEADAIKKIGETCELYTKYLPDSSVHSDNELLRMACNKEYKEVYGFLHKEERNTRWKRFFRKVAVRIKQMYVYRLNQNRVNY